MEFGHHILPNCNAATEADAARPSFRRRLVEGIDAGGLVLYPLVRVGFVKLEPEQSSEVRDIETQRPNHLLDCE